MAVKEYQCYIGAIYACSTWLSASLLLNSTLSVSVSCSPPTSSSAEIDANFLALVLRSNSASSSAYVLFFGSGRRKNTQTSASRETPPQKKPALPPQFHAPAFSCRVIRMLQMMDVML